MTVPAGRISYLCKEIVSCTILVANSTHNVDIPVPVNWQGKMYVSMVPSTIKVERRFISEADTVMFACTVHEGRNLAKHSTHKQKLPWVLVKEIKIPILV